MELGTWNPAEETAEHGTSSVVRPVRFSERGGWTSIHNLCGMRIFDMISVELLKPSEPCRVLWGVVVYPCISEGGMAENGHVLAKADIWR
jgi:hypothetical protein